jgi:NADH-quinone oxidoreductase subunit J
MTLHGLLFYIIAALILLTTVLGLTRRNLVHAVIYLIFSFFGTALIFFLLGAPFLAALQVIIYAGAIMILFLFIVMMLRLEQTGDRLLPPAQLIPAAVFGLVFLMIGAVVVSTDPAASEPLMLASATPREFGRYLFLNHWLSVEIVSMLLLVVLAGALHLGNASRKMNEDADGDAP